MNPRKLVTVLILLGICSITSMVKAQMETMMKDHVMMNASDFKWGPGPPGLPAGSETAVIEGDPSKPGSYTIRAKIPAGYKIMPHTHPTDEHVTVMEGSCYMGLGPTIDEKTAMKLTVGGFCELNAGTVHYFYTTSACVIQLHGVGPWDIKYVNSKDDPRNMQKQ